MVPLTTPLPQLLEWYHVVDVEDKARELQEYWDGCEKDGDGRVSLQEYLNYMAFLKVSREVGGGICLLGKVEEKRKIKLIELCKISTQHSATIRKS